MAQRSMAWMRRFLSGCIAMAALQLLGAAPAMAAATPCVQLGYGTQVGKATIILAQAVAAGDYTAAGGAKLKNLPAFCRVFAVASTGLSSRILIEIWMPAADGWNGKLLGVGSGGASGAISPQSLAGGLRRGYAAATTDMGSYPAGQPGIGFNFGDGRPETIRDWASRSTHEMTLLAKAVVQQFYGRQASKAYFVGCSTGGHQGLSEAQRYPEDYDGIIAGAPAHDRTRLHVRFAALQQLGMRLGAAIPAALLKTWQEAILKSCGGRDGGVPGDKFLTNPLRCTLSPRQLACKETRATDSCFTKTQVQALEAIYSGTRNPRTGEMIYFADNLGAETQLMDVYGDTSTARNFNIAHWILPPERSAASFDFDADMKALDDRYAADANAMDPDLSRFAARGGKLIMYHGWNDGLIPALGSVDYFRSVRADGRGRDSFARLFLAPGMAHCAAGPGLGLFGQLVELAPDAGATADTDLLLALDRWSTGGQAPDRIVGKVDVNVLAVLAGTAHGGATRPMCAWPNAARYRGKGDPKLAGSFTCVSRPAPTYERPAPEYLR